jgi:hypothetical protein
MAVRTAPYAARLRWSGAVVLVGTFLTALGFLLGGAYWLLVALAVFASTLLSLLAAAYGKPGAVAGNLLNIWFVIILSDSHALHKSPAQTWPLVGPQALAWLAGGVLWLVVAGLLLMLRRARQSALATPAQPLAPAHWSHALVAFALLGAVAVALATAVAWGFALANADWMPIAAIIAMKPSFQASAYVGAQRVAGAILGGVLAALLLSTVHDRFSLEVAYVLLLALANAIHDVNYAFYATAISASTLIALGLPHPGSWTDIWQRVGWTLAGVAIALAVMLIAAGLASQRASQSEPQSASTTATAAVAARAAPQSSNARPPASAEMSAPSSVMRAPSAAERAQRQVALARGQASLAQAFEDVFPRQVADYHAQLRQIMDRALRESGALDLLRSAASLLGGPSQPETSEYLETDLTTWYVHPAAEAHPDGLRSSSDWTGQEEERHTTHFRGYVLEIPGTPPLAICLGYLLERVPVFAIHTQAELDRLAGSAPFTDLFRCDLPVIRSPQAYAYVPVYEVDLLQRGQATSHFPAPRHRSAELRHIQHDMHVITGPHVLDRPHFLVTAELPVGASALHSVAELPRSLGDLQRELTPTSLARIQGHLAAQLVEVLHHIRPALWAEPVPLGQGQPQPHPVMGLRPSS